MTTVSSFLTYINSSNPHDNPKTGDEELLLFPHVTDEETEVTRS